jgi:hypothetical protein
MTCCSKRPQIFSPGEDDTKARPARPPLAGEKKSGLKRSRDAAGEGEDEEGGGTKAPLDPEEVERRRLLREERVRRRREEVRGVVLLKLYLRASMLQAGSLRHTAVFARSGIAPPGAVHIRMVSPCFASVPPWLPARLPTQPAFTPWPLAPAVLCAARRAP